MLELTLATDFLPGTNQKGHVAGANWYFLLPSLEVKRILCIGMATSRTLTALREITDQITVMCAHKRTVRKLTARTSANNDAAAIAFRGTVRSPEIAFRQALSADQFDLIVISRQGERWLNRHPSLRQEITRVLNRRGLVYLEARGFADSVETNGTLKFLQKSLGCGQRFWLTPLSNEMQTAVPLQDERTLRYFLRNLLYSPAINFSLPRRVERLLRPMSTTPVSDRVEHLLSRHLLCSRLFRRCGTLSGTMMTDSAVSPPRYLTSMARKAGIDIGNHRWGLYAAGPYRSRKVLFFLFPREEEHPEYVVKMVRDRTLNSRLENECRALKLLRERGISHAERLPVVRFSGHHGGLAIVGESAIHGFPLRRKTKATVNCPYASNAIDWLIDLGARTAGPTASSSEAADSLQTLLSRFSEIYHVQRSHAEFLAAQLATVRDCGEEFPLVFQHGDPGVWNVLITANEEAAFLDWEAAEPCGIPLWDLFYFLRSHGVTVARRAGTKDSLLACEQQFVNESAFSLLVANSVSRYCDVCRVPPQLVRPLFYTCWMHRALKEATRLSKRQLERGHYVNLLRLCIERRDAPALRRLFSEAQTMLSPISSRLAVSQNEQRPVAANGS